MPEFLGTAHEFKRYIGPRLRNLINYITRHHKIAVGACQFCGVEGELDAAHVHGRDRNDIIDQILGSPNLSLTLRIDLEEFEEKFLAAHKPLEKSIYVLCKPCHRKYDATPTRTQTGTEIRGAYSHGFAGSSETILPITLIPSPAAAFRQRLLSTQRAMITTYYGDGRTEERVWNASRFRPDSNVMGNLRSRPEFRQGTWQASGIITVQVKVLEDT